MNRRRGKDIRKGFIDTFVRLWGQQDDDSLTITALVAESGYSRASFYRYFDNLDNLIVTVVNDMIAELFTRVGQQETRLAEMAALFSYISENERLFRAYFALPAPHPARQILADELMNFLDARYDLRDDVTGPLELARDFWIGSTLSVIGLYLENIEKGAPEDMARVYIDLMMKSLASTALVLRPEWLQRRPRYLSDD